MKDYGFHIPWVHTKELHVTWTGLMLYSPYIGGRGGTSMLEDIALSSLPHLAPAGWVPGHFEHLHKAILLAKKKEKT